MILEVKHYYCGEYGEHCDFVLTPLNQKDLSRAINLCKPTTAVELHYVDLYGEHHSSLITLYTNQEYFWKNLPDTMKQPASSAKK